MPRGASTLMFAEAADASAVAERQSAELPARLHAVATALRAADIRLVLTCARGSSDHAATFAKYLIETRARVPVASHAPSISSLYDTHWRRLDHTLFLAISQSGRSPDLVASAIAAKRAGAIVVAVVNDDASPLAAGADHVIPLLAGPERSVAATKSYLGSLLALIGLVGAWSGDDNLAAAARRAPDVLRAAWQLDWSAALPLLVDADHLFVLARGLGLGCAQEIALKLKETCGLHAEAFSMAEVRHGPMALVGTAFPVLALASADVARTGIEDTLRQFVDHGAPVLCAGQAIAGVQPLPTIAGVDPVLSGVAMVQSFYRLAVELSVARGFDPDRPHFLQKVTATL